MKNLNIKTKVLDNIRDETINKDYDYIKEKEEREKKERKRERKRLMKEQIAILEEKKKNKKKKKKSENDVLSYYKKFKEKPIDFRKKYSQQDSLELYLSSDNDYHDSSDDFPSPGKSYRSKNSHDNKKEINNDLFKKMKMMSRRINELELQNKNLKK